MAKSKSYGNQHVEQTMIKIYYPDVSVFKNPNSVWYHYLLSGFKEIGEVVISKELGKKSHYVTGFTVLAIDIEIKGKKTRIWYDFCDFRVIHMELMEEGNLYFKIMCHYDYPEKYKNVYPIGQTTASMNYFKLLPSLRKSVEKEKYDYDVVAVFRTTNYSLRKKCIEIIKKQKNWNTLSGLCFFRNRPDIPKELMTEKLPFGVHLERQSKSKICVSLPGVGGGDDWCWRETEVLGMGGCLLNIEMNYLMPGDDEHYKKNCQITIKKDLSDLVEKIDYYLTHEEERKQIAKNGLEYYEQWLTPKAMAQNIIDRVKDNG